MAKIVKTPLFNVRHGELTPSSELGLRGIHPLWKPYTPAMKLAWAVLACASVAACGDDDSGGGSGGTGSATGGAGGAVGGAAGSGGASGSSSGGAAGSVAAGGAFSCKAATNQYPNVNCKSACEHFNAWGSGGSCATPYAGDPQCELACDTIKNSGPYVNALFGCAGDNADCLGWKACLKLICG